MINFKITSLGDGSLTLESSAGKSVQFSPGETLKAEVVNLLPSGDVTIKVKGEFLTAKTTVPLQEGQTVFFQVSDSPSSANELRLRFVGYEDSQQGSQPAANFMSTSEGQTLAALIQELSDSLLKQNGTPSTKNQDSAAAQKKDDLMPAGRDTADSENTAEALTVGASTSKDQGSADAQTKNGFPSTGNGEADQLPSAGSSAQDAFPLDKIESLLKALPSDVNALPKEIKTQLQDLLLGSLRSTGQSIQSRLATVSSQLSAALRDSPAAANIKPDTMPDIERMLALPLKNALLNTGVVFEAKLKSAAIQMQFETLLSETETGQDTSGQVAAQDLPPRPAINALSDALLESTAGTQEPVSPEALDPTFEQALQDIGAASAGTLSVAGAGEGSTKVIIQPGGQQETSKAERSQAANTEDQTSKLPSLPALKNDLKAVLLELKQRLSSAPESGTAAQDAKTPDGKSPAQPENAAVLRNLQGRIEGLLKDIETFQALSKTTDSFYTFLPVTWKELKDGDVAFRRGRGGAGGEASSSCRINLDLDKFGNLSILVLMSNKDFFVSFKAENPKTNSLLGSNLDELKSSFREKGLSLKAVHMLDKADTSMEHLSKLGTPERILSIKA